MRARKFYPGGLTMKAGVTIVGLESRKLQGGVAAMESDEARREFLRIATLTGLAGAGLLLAGCGRVSQTQPEQKPDNQAEAEKGDEKDEEDKDDEDKGGDVTATEDLMREHGVLRRALLVYASAATRLRADPSAVSPEALQKTASLFRAFGEERSEERRVG